MGGIPGLILEVSFILDGVRRVTLGILMFLKTLDSTEGSPASCQGSSGRNS